MKPPALFDALPLVPDGSGVAETGTATTPTGAAPLPESGDSAAHQPSGDTMRDTWTDEQCTAHYVEHGRTLCDVLVLPTAAHAVDGCHRCVRAALDDYARRHRCGVVCRA